jgi:hypothetical protein
MHQATSPTPPTPVSILGEEEAQATPKQALAEPYFPSSGSTSSYSPAALHKRMYFTQACNTSKMLK